MNCKSPRNACEMKLGATLALDENASKQADLCGLLEQMKRDGFNTVNFYGLEHVRASWETLFAALDRLQMQAVVRIEDYGAGFSFSAQEDVPDVLSRYQALLDWVCTPDHRSRVAYFALNMPVDDGRVTGPLGGVNSPDCRRRQVEYAASLVSAMRMETHRRGFSTAKLYLSVFYGWDNTYDVPSYAAAGADGYFLNNYSYPAEHLHAPTLPCTDEELINRRRLSVAVEKYRSQYPGMPLIVEFGFHTLEYNHGQWPGQTAGLVGDRPSKEQAIRATLDFYETVPEFRGYLYFGYDLYKEEGEPPAVMDWALRYPEEDAV